MKVEFRADGLHITGYVNVTGKQSRPVIVNKQKVIEVIEERAFQRALEKTKNVPMSLDHNENRVLSQTDNGSLELREDQIGLRASTIITDSEVIQNFKKLKGWSFGMRRVVDTIEEREGQLPLRHVKDFELDHVTLVMNKYPAYSATSIELRADAEDAEEIEIRSFESEVEIIEMKKPIDYSEIEARIKKIQ